MASRLKEDEKNERTIRSLLKLPANKKCINCNSVGPQYVCTNFWTFVCTTCSGIHREYTHRVKSVSMAKFTSQEVAALQSGGNEHAKSIYFKDWDAQHHSYPNSSNINRLRDFIRHVYVDRRFSGGKSPEKAPRNEDSYESRSDAFRGGSRTHPYEDTYNHRRNDMPSPGGRSNDNYSKYDDRSPGHDRESRHPRDQGRSPSRPQIINDWCREDRFGNSKKSEDHRTSDGDSLSDDKSPDHQKDKLISSPPVVRPLRDILGDDVIPLKIDPPKPNGIRAADTPVHVVDTAFSSSFGSSEGFQVEPKRETLASLIDFDADPEPPAVAASTSQTEQTNSVLTTVHTISSASNDNWASFNFTADAKLPQVQSSSSNSLDSLFMQLTASSSVSAQSGQSQTPNLSVSSLVPGGTSNPDVPVGLVPVSPFHDQGFTVPPISSGVTFSNMNASGSWSAVQHQQQPPSFPSFQPHTPSIQQPSNIQAAQLPQSVSNTTQDVANGFETQPQKAEITSSGRSALPEDLFSATYHTSLTAPHGWHTGHPAGMGFGMHYNVLAPSHHFQQPPKSSNPFDLGNESSAAPAQSFPSMAPLHGALPTVSGPSSGMHISGVGTPSPAYLQPQMSQAPPLHSAGTPLGAYLGQEVPQRMPAIGSRGDGIADSSVFGNASHLLGGGYPAPTAPISFPSAGGNPFG